MKTLPRNTVLTGDAKAVLPNLLAESVDSVVTSPPYAGRLRDYGHPEQLGQEECVYEYVGNLLAVLAEVRRVLKPTGSLWLNLGDCYAKRPAQGVPRGSLLLTPQRIALALSVSGWIVRNVCVWHKPNPLPQSAQDRLSPTYEVVIFATKQRDYFFDLDAVRVPHRSANRIGRIEKPRGLYQGGNRGLDRLRAVGGVGNPRGKNPGDVWTHATAVDRLGHQATFPERLIKLPILATCPERICVQCDTAWTRPTRIDKQGKRIVGELRRCDCFSPSRPGVVLDPFFGTGTVGAVARKLRRDWLGIELNSRYADLARERLGICGGRLRGERKGSGLSARRNSHRPREEVNTDD